MLRRYIVIIINIIIIIRRFVKSCGATLTGKTMTEVYTLFFLLNRLKFAVKMNTALPLAPP